MRCERGRDIYFKVKKGLRRMSNAFERVVRQVNDRTTGKDLKPRDENRRSWEIKLTLHVDDSVVGRFKILPPAYWKLIWKGV